MDCFTLLSEWRPRSDLEYDLKIKPNMPMIRKESTGYLTNFDNLIDDRVSLSDESEMDVRHTKLMTKVHLLGLFERKNQLKFD